MGLYIWDGESSGIITDPIAGATVLTIADIGILVASVGAALSNFVWEQDVPLAHWIIQHNLGRFPPIAVVDSANSVVMGFVTYVDANQITIDFQSSFSGKAFM